MCFSAKNDCVGEHCRIFLCAPDVVPSQQALGLAHAAHQPHLGLIISPYSQL